MLSYLGRFNDAHENASLYNVAITKIHVTMVRQPGRLRPHSDSMPDPRTQRKHHDDIIILLSNE